MSILFTESDRLGDRLLKVAEAIGHHMTSPYGDDGQFQSMCKDCFASLVIDGGNVVSRSAVDMDCQPIKPLEE